MKSKKILLSTLSSALFLAALPYSYSQDEDSDAWFSKDHEAAAAENAEENDGQDALFTTGRKSSRALYNRLIKNYEAVSQTNLSKRISVLEEAITTAPKHSKDVQAILAELKERKNDVLEAIESAGQSLSSIDDSIQLLSPHAEYFTGDSSLLFQLLNSSFVDRLDRRIRALGRSSDFDEIAEMKKSITNAGLIQVIGNRFNETTSDALTSIIERRWDVSSREFSPLVGEAFLLGRLIQAPQKKLSVQVVYPSGINPKLSANISRSLERNWGNDFQISSSTRNPDLILEINGQAIETTRNEGASLVASSIPGKVVEEPNPDFMIMVKRYEKAAKSYAVSMDAYEVNYQRYLDDLKEGPEVQEAAGRVEQTENDLASALSNPGSSAADINGAMASASEAKVFMSGVTRMPMPEPRKPIPIHLDILDELYLIPSTIVTSSESTPYEYTTKELDYTFVSEAELALKTSADSNLKVEGSIDLQQKRDWVKNEGIHRSDPTAGPGTFSESELNSALDLFSLSFGTSCSKEFGELLAQANAHLSGSRTASQNIEQAFLKLSLAAQQSGSTSYALSSNEISELAELARTSSVSASQFRLACLSLIIEKSELAGTISQQDLQGLL